MVNVAFDAPVDFAPRDQIEDAERRLYELAETGRYGGGFQRFETALTTAVEMAATRLSARRQAVGSRHRLARSRPQDGRPAEIRPDHPRRPPRHGQDRARDQHRLQRRQGLARRSAAGRHDRRPSMAASSASSRSKCRPSSSPPASSPSRPESPRPAHPARRDRPSTISTQLEDVAIEMQHDAALHRRDRRPLDRAACRARAPAEAPEAGSTCWSSITSSFCQARRAARRRAACRR